MITLELKPVDYRQICDALRGVIFHRQEPKPSYRCFIKFERYNINTVIRCLEYREIDIIA